ncbi:MAG: sugar ABC transporter permease [Ilumatobacter sp.]|uniref:carbohydrate ABC transporter permease n=1 Tax=Ilumatobacter sp. TaxID=1967498 RepID=UPI003C772092
METMDDTTSASDVLTSGVEGTSEHVGTPLDATPFLAVGIGAIVLSILLEVIIGIPNLISAAIIALGLIALLTILVDRRTNGRRDAGFIKQIAIGAAVIIALSAWSVSQDKVRTTMITIAVAVLGSAGLWVGANLLFDQARNRWKLFSGVAFGVIGFLLGVVLHGNHVTLGSGQGFLTWVVGPLVGAAAFAALGIALSSADEPAKRMTIGVGFGAALGVVIGAVIRSEFHPGLDPLAIVVWTVAVLAVGAGISAALKKNPLHGALVGGALGWTLGAWGGATFGDGNIATSIIASVVPAVLLGVRLGQTPNPDYKGRAQIDLGSRAYIFVGPALLFVAAMLVVPALQTAYISLLGSDSEEFLGLDNYGSIFTDATSLDLEDWTNMFTSVPFLIGAVLLVISVFVGISMKAKTGRAVEVGNPTMFPLVVGGFLLAFGVFTALRGTIINNLWWVVVVTSLSTTLGLAVAVLADGRRGERFAKSLIFMPMAISLVGASIIWRFMYAAENVPADQTGVLNALWVGLGTLSTGSGLPTLIVTIVAGLVLLGLLAVLAKSLVARNFGRGAAVGVATVLVGWFFVRFAGIVGGGVGGFEVLEDGTTRGQTILFVQEAPYNNFWLMIILVWIQTGFAMVILSAAIKAVPTELIEAARMDGATESQVFWRVTLPQIGTTIGVVVTTILVLVMKVFDIVKVINNGNLGTQVLANDMFNQAFSFGEKGLGAALAMLIFFSVLPVMVFNVRRMQAEEG